VEAGKRQPFGEDDLPVFGALFGADITRPFGQREGGDFDAGIPGFADRLAGVCKRPLVEGLVADGMAKLHELSVY